MAMRADGVSGRAVLREWKPLPELGGLRASLAEAALLCVSSSPPFLPAHPSFPSAPSNRPSPPTPTTCSRKGSHSTHPSGKGNQARGQTHHTGDPSQTGGRCIWTKEENITERRDMAVAAQPSAGGCGTYLESFPGPAPLQRTVLTTLRMCATWRPLHTCTVAPPLSPPLVPHHTLTWPAAM